MAESTVQLSANDVESLAARLLARANIWDSVGGLPEGHAYDLRVASGALRSLWRHAYHNSDIITVTII